MSSRVLFVSKPVVEPFHDGSICLVRDLASSLTRWQPQVMGIERATDTPLGDVRKVYGRGGRYAPAMSQNVRALTYLLGERSSDLWHFVFAPNPRSSGAIRWLRRLRRVPVVQTVASPPRNFDSAEQLLFGDEVVVHSDWTRQRLQAALPGASLHLIRPPLGAIAEPTADEVAALRAKLNIRAEQRVVVYPGDLEFSNGAQLVAETVPLICGGEPELVVVFACRRKTARAVELEARLAASLSSAHVRFAGELPSLLPLLRLADCVLFPVEQLWAKVDIPISILEAMALGTPVVVPEEGPLSEIVAAERVPARPAELAQAVNALSCDPNRRSEQVAAQRRLLETEYAADVAARGYEQLYDTACAKNRR